MLLTPSAASNQFEVKVQRSLLFGEVRSLGDALESVSASSLLPFFFDGDSGADADSGDACRRSIRSWPGRRPFLSVAAEARGLTKALS